MAQSRQKVICPYCGAEMNHHADKLVDATNEEQSRAMDASLGGWIEEFHGCPRCGRSASRAA